MASYEFVYFLFVFNSRRDPKHITSPTEKNKCFYFLKHSLNLQCLIPNKSSFTVKENNHSRERDKLVIAHAFPDVISHLLFKDIIETVFHSLSFKMNTINHTNLETSLEIQVLVLSLSKYPTFL